jgi:hypothetical protein
MRKGKRALRFAASVTLLACICSNSGIGASALQSSSASIVGRWRSLETSKGGLGSIIEFRSDGTVDFGIGAVVEMPWRIENNQLILPSETNGGAERKVSLKWLGDKKLSLVSEAAVIELTRVGDRADTGNPILGEWIENREIAGRNLEAHYLFYPASKLLFIMPFVTEHGSYTISGSTLHIIKLVPKPKSISDLFELSENLLTLSEPKGGPKDRFVRY